MARSRPCSSAMGLAGERAAFEAGEDLILVVAVHVVIVARAHARAYPRAATAKSSRWLRLALGTQWPRLPRRRALSIAGRSNCCVAQRAEQVLQIWLRGILLAFRCAVEKILHDLEAERAIALELRFGKPLVGRALVREIEICHGIAAHAGAFGSMVSGLHVEDQAVLHALAVRLLVVDIRDRVIVAMIQDVAAVDRPP